MISHHIPGLKGYCCLVVILIFSYSIGQAQFVVSNTNDNGAGSLRAAIESANAAATAATISFNIDGDGPWVITLVSGLQPILNNDNGIVIDGTTQPGWAFGDENTMVTVDATAFSSGSVFYANSAGIEIYGLAINSGGVNSGITIGTSATGAIIGAPGKGNVINEYRDYGIGINGSDVLVQGNYIGTTIDGSAADSQTGRASIYILSFAGNIQIGGDATTDEGNVLSGNSFSFGGYGVWIADFNNGTNYSVLGNYIGTDATGQVAIGNHNHGVHIEGGTDVYIGGSGTGEGNVISGAGDGGNSSGVHIDGGSNVDVINNLIGIDATGMLPIPNGTNGIFVETGVPGLDIQGNTVSASHGRGIRLFQVNNYAVTITGNKIGTDINGDAGDGLGNGVHGIDLSPASGEDAMNPIYITNNIISGNGTIGVGWGITGSGSSYIQIEENLVGVESDGITANGNFSGGIGVPFNGTNISVGGVGVENIVAHNGGTGIVFSGDQSTSSVEVNVNHIFCNSTSGLNLSGSGPTVTPPVVTGVASGVVSGTSVEPEGSIIRVYGTEGFCDNDQGAVYLGSTTVDGDGNWSANVSYGGTHFVTTVTNAVNGTSNYSSEFENPDQPFITTWVISGGQLTIPVFDGPLYDYKVYYENESDETDNGSFENQAGSTTISGLTNDDVYRVEITGTFPRIYFNNTGDKDKIRTVEQWGNIEWTSMDRAFYGCTLLTIEATDAPDLTTNTDISLFRMFSGATAMNQSINHWNVNNVVSFSHLFEGASIYNQPLDNWNPPGLTDIKLMFKDAVAFNQSVNHFDVDQVTDFAGTFEGATSFNQPLDNWDVGLGQLFGNMFFGASSFDQSLGDWDISSATSMDWMLFNSGISTANFDRTLIGWADLDPDAGEVQIPTDITLYANLTYCNAISALATLESTYTWDIQNETLDCSDVAFITTWRTDNDGTSLDTQLTIPTEGTGYNYNVNWFQIGNPDNSGSVVGITGDYTIDVDPAGTYQVEISGDFPRIYFNNEGDRQKILTVEQWGSTAWSSMENAFYGCSNVQLNATDVPDLSNLVSMQAMFSHATNFADNNSMLEFWDLNGVENIAYLFRNISTFDEDISGWDVSTVQTMSAVFQGCSAFDQDISGWVVNEVTSFASMFQDATSFDQDIGGWNMTDATHFSNMFRGATSFDQDISEWDMSSARFLIGMFQDADAFDQDISGWNIGAAENISSMFHSTDRFNAPIGSWNTESVTNMTAVFYGTVAFNQDLSGWDVDLVSNMNLLFGNAQAFDQSLAVWDISSVTNMTGMLDDAAMSTANYDATLIGWLDDNSGTETIPTGITLGASGLTYCEAAIAHQTLEDSPYDWTINDAGLGCNLLVINTNDSGEGSLRNAIEVANASASHYTIQFNIPDSDPGYLNDGSERWTIQPLTELPEIDDDLILDATTQPGSGDYRIRIDGQDLLDDGLYANAMVEIYGFYLEGFTLNNGSTAIYLRSGAANSIIGSSGAGNLISNNYYGIRSETSGASIQGNLIGTDDVGTSLYANQTGIYLLGSASTVGGDLASERNVISGNTTYGIQINASDHVIDGNYIGVDATGLVSLANGDGIYARGTNAITDNVISGNSDAGILSVVSNATIIQGNYIGVGSDGSTAVPNGIGIESGWNMDNNVIGGTEFGQANIIAYNTNQGIFIENSGSEFNQIIGNQIYCNGARGIDLNMTDTDELGNDGKVAPVITSVSVGEVSGTGVTDDVIHVYRDNSGCVYLGADEYLGSTTVVDGAWTFTDGSIIATDEINATATDASGNTSQFARNYADDWFTVTNTNDTGSGSLREAIIRANELSGSHTIDFNIPDTDPNYASGARETWTITPATQLPSITSPNLIIDASTQPGDGDYNIILDGNSGGFVGFYTNTNYIEFYGFNITGFTTGIQGFYPSGFVTIGAPGKGNVIHNCGTAISATNADDYTIQSNIIGLDVTGTSAMPNSGGIALGSYANNTLIGGPNADERNIISGNTGSAIGTNTGSGTRIVGNYIGTDITGSMAIPNNSGVQFGTSGSNFIIDNVISGNTNQAIYMTLSSGNTIQGNLIGTATDGSSPLPNGVGIETNHQSGVDMIVGGLGVGEGNTIAYNTNQGVKFTNASNLRNQVIGNAIFCNGEGIDLGGVGHNNIQSPTITEVTASTVSGTGVNGDEIHVYRDNSGCYPFQGHEYLGMATVTDGTWSVIGLTLGDTDFITATATNAVDGTSEYSEIFDLSPRMALDFDATDDVVNLGNSSGFNIGTSFTFESRVKVNSIGVQGMLFSKWVNGGEDKHIFIRNNGQIGFGMSGVGSAFSDDVIPVGQWVHVACSYDGTNMRFYFNGNEVGVTARSGDPSDGVGDAYLGGNPGRDAEMTTGYLDGQMDDVRFWNTTRSQAQIQDNMYTELAGSESGLIAYYNFNHGVPNADNSGVTTLVDHTGNGNDGTLEDFGLTGTTSNWVETSAFHPPIVTSITDISPSGFTVNWDAVAGGYNIQLDLSTSDDFGSMILSGHSLGTSGTSVISQDLSASNFYYYRVHSTVPGVENGYTATGSFVLVTEDAFVTTWQTDNAGTSDDDQIMIPLSGTGYDLYWEEVDNIMNNGIESSGLVGTHAITFPQAGTYRVIATGDFNRINFNNEGDRQKILTVEQWGDAVWTNWTRAFYGCSQIDITATDAPDLSNIDLMWHTFAGCESLNAPMNDWNVSNITDMNNMFNGASSFNQDLDNWDVDQVESMANMFNSATAFNGDVTTWIVSGVESMNGMFFGCTAFNQDVSNWTTTSLTTAGAAFSGASSFNQSLANWDMDLVTDLTDMLDNTNLSIDNYDATLNGWSEQTLQNDVSFGASGLSFCNGGYGRDEIEDSYNWSIDDAGGNCSATGGVTAQDYEALESLYQELNGENWTDNSGWLLGNVEDWYGVSVNGIQVSTIDLRNNNLSGVVPVEIGNLTGLISLDLSDNGISGALPYSAGDLLNITTFDFSGNQISDLPDLSGISGLTVLRVEDNLLEFDDIEPYMSIETYSYSPQALIAGPGNQALNVGDDLDITIAVGGSNNTYQWVKDEGDLIGQDSDNLVVNDLELDDSGTYYLRVTNSVVTGLTITSESFDVTVSVLALSVSANTTTTKVCLGDEVTLTGSGADSYTWDNDVTDGVAFTPTETATYTVTGTSGAANGTDEVTVTVIDLPVPTISEEIADEVNLISSSESGNQWFRAGEEIIGQTKQTLTLRKSAESVGTYSVRVFSEGCTVFSDAFDFYILATEDLSQQMSMWPNPSNGLLHLSIPNTVKSQLKIQIINLNGITVLDVFQVIDDHNLTLDISQIPTGVYLMKIEGFQGHAKLIKQ